MTELSGWEQVKLYLYGRRHLAGCVAALAGLVLYFFGLIDRGWWAIVLGLYLGGVLVMPKDDTADRLTRARFDETNLREHLDELLKMARHRVPAEAGHRLEAIRGHAELLLPKLKELTERGALSATVRHDVLQTLIRYLPDTLATYFRLPKAYARLHSDGAGKTPDALLIEQLRILEDNLGRAVQEAYAEDISNLEIQGRFLSDKFSQEPR